MQNNCPLCQGETKPLPFTARDHFLSGEEFTINKCKDCSFCITLDLPSEMDIGKYYKSSAYISHSDTSKGIINRMYHLARRWMLKRKYRTVCMESGLAKGRLLDIGCGTGYFAGFMKKMGWDSIGIEADPGAKKFAEEKFALQVFSLDKLADFKSSEFDVITLWHVLEHLESPKTILKEINRILDTKGICLLALPNSDSYDARYYKEYWAAWDVPRHLWHFNIRSFNRLLESTGMTLKGIRKMPLDSFYISILSERYKKSGMAFLKGLTIGKIGWVKSWFKKSEASSLIYILQKGT